MKKNCQISKKKKKNVSRFVVRGYEAAGGPPRPKSLLSKGFRFFESYLVGFSICINSMNVGLRDISYAGLFILDCNFSTNRNNRTHFFTLQILYLDIFDIAHS